MISFVEYLPNPQVWESVRFKFLSSARKGKLPPSSEEKPNDDETLLPYLAMEYLRGESSPENFVSPVGMVVASEGDILLLWDGSNAGEFLQAKHGVVSSTTALVEVTNESVNVRYIYWASKAIEPILRTYTVGMGIPHVDGEFLKNISLLVPPLATQRRITDYLDRETVRIDALVAEKEKMLALLEEKRAALISRAVTRGLNPDAPMKPSGLDWLGEIPAHWETRRLKFVTETLEQGNSPVAANTPAGPDELGILKLSAVSKGRFRHEENKALKESDGTEQVLSLKKGDVLITRGNTPDLVADVAYVPNDEPNLLLPDLIYRLRVQINYILPEYVTMFLTTSEARVQIRRDARGSSGTMVKVSQNHVLDWQITLPPLDEQDELVKHMKSAGNRFQNITNEITRTISLLKERRAALITAAVTGQLDLKEIAA